MTKERENDHGTRLDLPALREGDRHTQSHVDAGGGGESIVERDGAGEHDGREPMDGTNLPAKARDALTAALLVRLAADLEFQRARADKWVAAFARVSEEFTDLKDANAALRVRLAALLEDVQQTAERWHADPLVADDQAWAARAWAHNLAAVLNDDDDQARMDRSGDPPSSSPPRGRTE
jgi:hypothetical protein